jgi:hypothetical protein
MKIEYYAETDSLYIKLSSRPSVDRRVVSEGIVRTHPKTLFEVIRAQSI